jgi:FixJ family two-component response regulator
MDMLDARGRCGRSADDSSPARIGIVDDDASVRTALTHLLTAEGFVVAAFESSEAFLAQFEPAEHGCVILDVAMPGLDGLALQQAMASRASHMPVIFLTGQADIPMCAHAMKQGAADFLIKPVDAAVLLASIELALAHDLLLRKASQQRAATESRAATLTARERQVLTHVIAGRLNKQIAADLGTTEKTIKVHRARGMEKMQVRSVAELVRIVERSHPQGLELPR